MMPMNDFMANTLSPFLRKNRVLIFIVIVGIASTVFLFSMGPKPTVNDSNPDQHREVVH